MTGEATWELESSSDFRQAAPIVQQTARRLKAINTLPRLLRMCLASCRMLPVINTDDAWAALRGHFELDSPVKVRVHKVMHTPPPESRAPGRQTCM